MSSKNDGSLFHQNVKRLLEMQGYSVEHEQIVGHKKVDLLARTANFGKPRITAVECKDYSKPLNAEEAKFIYVDYEALIDSGTVADVLLVTRAGLTPSALTYVQSKRHYYHRTLDELFNSIINFGPYLGGLINSYHASGLPSYYVDPMTTDGEPAEQLIYRWMAEEQADPLAILAGYGMGKSTLASHFASTLADSFLKTQTGRIPILVRLYEIAKEQSLEGLLGKVFTAYNCTPGYSFDGWMALNAAGKFVVLLDGFDEMKYMISRDEFSHNFSEFSRLIHPQSKLIILGRPTAFLSEDEYQELVRGNKQLLSHTISLGTAKYREVSLAPFSGSQVRRFLERYVPYRLRTEKTSGLRDERLIYDRIRAVSNKTLADIAQRPVQLRMLAEILPTFKGNIKSITLADLYGHFIDEILKRETSKLTRRTLSVSERRLFARRLAWYMWRAGGKRTINPHDIPDDLIRSIVPSNSHDIESVRRDLVAACFLEGKEGGHLYFPHRSFQEYLVAEEIVSRLQEGKSNIRILDDATNEEVAGFIKEIATQSMLQGWRQELYALRAPVSLRTINILSKGLEFDRVLNSLEEQSRNRWNSWQLLLVIGMLRKSRIAVSNERGRQLFTLFARLRHATNDEHQLGLLLFGVINVIGRMGVPVSRKPSHFMEIYLPAMLDCLCASFGLGTKSTDPRVAFEELFHEISKLPPKTVASKVSRYRHLSMALAAHQIIVTTKTLDLRLIYEPLYTLLENGPFIIEMRPLRKAANDENVLLIDIGRFSEPCGWLKRILELIPREIKRAEAAHV